MLELREYQERAADFIYEHDESLLRIPMGGGKTLSTLIALRDLLSHGVINGVLIVAPKRVADAVWDDEIRKWGLPFSYSKVLGTEKQRIAALQERPVYASSHIFLINYENLPWLEKSKLLPKYVDCVVFDELTRMKNIMAERSKAWRRLSKQFKLRIGLTGTFAANGLMDIHGQIRALDDGKRLGKGKTRFQETYYHRTGPMQWQWELKPDAEQLVADKIRDMVFEIDESEFLAQMPEFQQLDMRSHLPDEAEEEYIRMEERFVAYVTGEQVEAATAAVMRNKLRQIAAGFVYTETGAVEWLHWNKINTLMEVMETSGGPLMVCYDYRAEGDMAMSHLLAHDYKVRRIGGGASARVAKVAIEEWNAGKLDALLLHPASAGHGLNLQFGGHKLMWLSLPWSWELFEQARARLRRPGQEADRIIEFFNMAAPVDYAVRAALIDKKATDDALVAALRGEKS